MRTSSITGIMTLLAGAAGLAVAPPAASQVSGDGYLFGPPKLTINLHGGIASPDTSSDLFSFISELLTLERDSFTGIAAGSSVSVTASPRVTLGVSATYTGRTSHSEFRDWVEGEDTPIEQSTNFVRVPVLATAKLYLLPRGRTIGSFAWLPATYAPYVGGGAGPMWYRFRQVGDFVDDADVVNGGVAHIYTTELESSGWTSALQAVAGIDFSVTPRLAITAETNYIRSGAELGREFASFDRIDLSGFSATVALSLRL